MQKRTGRLLSAIAILTLTACEFNLASPTQASPDESTATATATETTPVPTFTPIVPPMPTDDLQDLQQELQDSLLPKIGSIPMAPVPEENTDESVFQISMRACLETETPNKSCNDATDLPLANITSKLTDEGGASLDLTTGESGWVKTGWPYEWVFRDKDNPTVTGMTMTEPQLKIAVTMPDGEVKKVCLDGYTADGYRLGGNIDWGYSEDACNDLRFPSVQAMVAGRRL